jgi:hypothetical protein
MKKKDISKGLIRQEEIAKIPDQIESQGGYREQVFDHKNNPSRAGTLSELMQKLREKGGSITKVVNNPVAKKAAIALTGPVGVALNAADALASVDEVGQGSDEIGGYPMEEALLEQPYENFADKDVSDQARRFQKIRSLMGK